ncbi:hypothetical protein ANO11243_054000 [Dothideomycetidae sp. 11243]|nr:hypothetical protein ANO11243_054000 [fungal sp. No.11243]
MFTDTPKYRDNHFQPLHSPLPTSASESPADSVPLNLDGNPQLDRPLFVQFCANKPDEFLAAAKMVAPYCDAVDLNLGCPQGIAKRGNYGAFLQEDWPTIEALISTLHKELSVPVTAKFRIQETREKTLDYARMILDAGASIITVHGRERHQKGHNTGLADWDAIRHLRENLPKETVIFANGNILQYGDVEACLEATGADGIMSAEGNLYDPSIFAAGPPVGEEGREYYRDAEGKGGWRMDAVLRRYLNILHEHVLKHSPPERKPLYIPSDAELPTVSTTEDAEAGPPPKKKVKLATTPKPDFREYASSPNMTAVQAHLFHLLRPLVAKHTHIRDMLARTRSGDIDGLERILSEVEAVVAVGIRDASTISTSETNGETNGHAALKPEEVEEDEDPTVSSAAAAARCRRPWFVCQPYVRPLPTEALRKGAMQLSKKMRRKLEEEEQLKKQNEAGKGEEVKANGSAKTDKVDSEAQGKVEQVKVGTGEVLDQNTDKGEDKDKVEVPREGLVCG